MRAVALAMLGACGFSPVAGTVDATRGDGKQPDARVIDAAVVHDASSTCISHSTALFNGHHYFRTAKEGWFASQAECLADGGHLVKLETQAESDFVANLVNTNFTWIGLSDPTSTDTYVWADGTPLGAYNGFNGGTPPTGTPDCVDSNGTWDTFGCTQTNHDGVCECE